MYYSMRNYIQNQWEEWEVLVKDAGLGASILAQWISKYTCEA